MRGAGHTLIKHCSLFVNQIFSRIILIIAAQSCQVQFSEPEYHGDDDDDDDGGDGIMLENEFLNPPHQATSLIEIITSPRVPLLQHLHQPQSLSP